MMLKVTGAIRRLMGWCPDTAMAGRRYAALEVEVGTAAGGGREVMEDALVDYGPVVTPGRFFLILLGGAGLLGCLYLRVLAAPITVPTTFAIPPAVGLLLLAVVLGYSALELYGAVRRARIEITRDAVIIGRPLFPPTVIPKDAVVKAEVKENKPPTSPWFLAVALAVLLVSAAGSIYKGSESPASMQFILGLAAVVFFPVIFFRTYLRIRYPRALVITTTRKRIAVIYTETPERIAQALVGFEIGAS